MKAKVVAVTALLAAAPALTAVASAGQTTHGSWSFTDYTPDTAALAAGKALYVTTGRSDTSYCHGGRVPAAPQDVTSHRFRVPASSTLQLTGAASGAWGFEVDNARGATLVGAATNAAGSTVGLKLRVRPGTYVVRACNLGGAPTAQVSYRLASAR